MHRTTIMLPGDLRTRALRQAKQRGVSLGELIRSALAARLATDRTPGDGDDPLYADQAVYRGPVPRDLSAKHDRYLYEE
ncbi:MAG: hypothetical protein HYZ53_25215 [Planctomycetes bacterium]|nr:hypothetical protein [Planctomycetota bacterium]